EGARVRRAVSRRDDQAPRRRARDGAGAVLDARRGPAVGDLRVRVGRGGGSEDGNRAHGRHVEGADEMRVLAAALSATLAIGAQQAPQPPAQQPPAQPPAQAQPEVVQTPPRASNDPRVNLKPGMRDAGQAIKNMELLVSVRKPESCEPKPAPAAPANGSAAAAPPGAGAPSGGGAPAAGRGNIASSLDFANSDIAF